MEDMRLKFYSPVVSGTVGAAAPAATRKPENDASGPSFQSMLKAQLDKTSGVSFSRHAVKRALEHNIELTDESLARLNEGMRLAGEKNLGDTLILVGSTAFLVNVRNNTVITTVGSNEMKGNVFTNIDGTVIV